MTILYYTLLYYIDYTIQYNTMQYNTIQYITYIYIGLGLNHYTLPFTPILHIPTTDGKGTAASSSPPNAVMGSIKGRRSDAFSLRAFGEEKLRSVFEKIHEELGGINPITGVSIRMYVHIYICICID